jgi:(+)-pinoresinol hydroxylase
MKGILIWAGLLAIAPVVVAVAKNVPSSPAGDPVERGRAVYEYNCATCHGAGPQKPGTAALAKKYMGQDVPPILEQRRDLTPDMIRYFARNGVNMMPTFRKTEISDEQMSDMIAYLLSKSANGGATVPTTNKKK